ncbi:lytic transglycosylase domain-containing protein [Alteraurantiacibacter aquimixticola]|uniref:Lytic transglycosylase domain-containing protein n=2 Tax=Alteraurantiacibacter aquimixticola TaxID=2489173 RepID=A0A4V4U910_9SPHN|nr:lytic transglycosylase domain-containing protein [Alteraurantiacibacter aquimixticola]
MASRAPHAAIAQAARRTGVDFSYLLAQARIESGMDPMAQARTSSASGLYQFIDQTWLATLDKHGDALGYGGIAQAIETRNGRARITDPSMRQAIMDLRFDPQAASLMAGALATDNRAALQPVLGRDPDASELYLAHFLGAGAAGRFLTTLTTDPDRPAAGLLPEAASANRAIFYERGGAERSVADVMALVRTRVEGAMADNGYAAGTPAPLPAIPASSRMPPPAWRDRAYPGLPPIAPPGNAPQRTSMADTLRDSFALTGADTQTNSGLAHIRKAYARMEAFGL